jgi:hypothetical protein
VLTSSYTWKFIFLFFVRFSSFMSKVGPDGSVYDTQAFIEAADAKKLAARVKSTAAKSANDQLHLKQLDGSPCVSVYQPRLLIRTVPAISAVGPIFTSHVVAQAWADVRKLTVGAWIVTRLDLNPCTSETLDDRYIS